MYIPLQIHFSFVLKTWAMEQNPDLGAPIIVKYFIIVYIYQNEYYFDASVASKCKN